MYVRSTWVLCSYVQVHAEQTHFSGGCARLCCYRWQTLDARELKCTQTHSDAPVHIYIRPHNTQVQPRFGAYSDCVGLRHFFNKKLHNVWIWISNMTGCRSHANVQTEAQLLTLSRPEGTFSPFNKITQFLQNGLEFGVSALLLFLSGKFPFSIFQLYQSVACVLQWQLYNFSA